MQVGAAYDRLRAMSICADVRYDVSVEVVGASGTPGRGLYVREPLHWLANSLEARCTITPKMHEVRCWWTGMISSLAPLRTLCVVPAVCLSAHLARGTVGRVMHGSLKAGPSPSRHGAGGGQHAAHGVRAAAVAAQHGGVAGVPRKPAAHVQRPRLLAARGPHRRAARCDCGCWVRVRLSPGAVCSRGKQAELSRSAFAPRIAALYLDPVLFSWSAVAMKKEAAVSLHRPLVGGSA